MFAACYNELQRGDDGGMRELIKDCLARAHQTISSNLVVLWFPPLFSTAMAVLVLLLTIIMLPAIPAQGSIGMPLGTVPWAGAMLVLAMASVAVLAAVNAGTMYLQGRAALGEKVDTGYFFLGIRRLMTKVLGGSLLNYSWYALLIIGFGWPILAGLGRLQAPGVTLADFPLAELELLILTYSSRVSTGTLLLITSVVLLSMWPRVLVLRDLGLKQALFSGVSFSFTNFLVVSAAFLLQWSINVALQRVFGPVFWLGSIVLTHALSVYVSVALMHYYLLRSTPKL